MFLQIISFKCSFNSALVSNAPSLLDKTAQWFRETKTRCFSSAETASRQACAVFENACMAPEQVCKVQRVQWVPPAQPQLTLGNDEKPAVPYTTPVQSTVQILTTRMAVELKLCITATSHFLNPNTVI